MSFASTSAPTPIYIIPLTLLQPPRWGRLRMPSVITGTIGSRPGHPGPCWPCPRSCRIERPSCSSNRPCHFYLELWPYPYDIPITKRARDKELERLAVEEGRLRVLKLRKEIEAMQGPFPDDEGNDEGEIPQIFKELASRYPQTKSSILLQISEDKPDALISIRSLVLSLPMLSIKN